MKYFMIVQNTVNSREALQIIKKMLPNLNHIGIFISIIAIKADQMTVEKVEFLKGMKITQLPVIIMPDKTKLTGVSGIRDGLKLKIRNYNMLNKESNKESYTKDDDTYLDDLMTGGSDYCRKSPQREREPRIPQNVEEYWATQMKYDNDTGKTDLDEKDSLDRDLRNYNTKNPKIPHRGDDNNDPMQEQLNTRSSMKFDTISNADYCAPSESNYGDRMDNIKEISKLDVSGLDQVSNEMLDVWMAKNGDLDDGDNWI
jgi:hypothetical protein